MNSASFYLIAIDYYLFSLQLKTVIKEEGTFDKNLYNIP